MTVDFRHKTPQSLHKIITDFTFKSLQILFTNASIRMAYNSTQMKSTCYLQFHWIKVIGAIHK